MRAWGCGAAMRRAGVCLAGALMVAPIGVTAQERILAYDSEVEVLADGSLEVTEHITVQAEGRNIRRGIYRDFPTRYRDRFDNQVHVRFEMVDVERNGEPEDWFTERRSNGIRINTGGDDFLPVPAEYTFTLRYRTTRQLGYFEEHDELYWNAIGTGWDFPIESGTVRVRLPSPVPVDSMGTEAYTGPQDVQGTAYAAGISGPGVAEFRLTGALQPREGFTIVLTFPKGIVQEPSTMQRAVWLLTDNRGVLVALAGLLVLLWYSVSRWREVGRDPRPGVIIPHYEPPEGHGPAALRYLFRLGGRYDSRCFSSDLLALAVAGRLRIGSRKKLLGDEWWLERVTGSGEKGDPQGGAHGNPHLRLVPAQEILLGKLFPGGKTRLDLENSNAATVSAAQSAHSKALDAELHPRFFKRNAARTAKASAIGVGTAILAFAVSGGNGIPFIVLLIGAMLLTVIAFGFLVRAPTPEGRRLMDEIDGLRLYLEVAERDELAAMPGPDEPPTLDAARYEALLPCAVALDVEDAWTSKFTAAAGAAAVAEVSRRMGWYSGHVPVSNLGNFTKAMGSTLSSRVASSSSPPGSSSGSGGGGSSGGGGGGGGGGGR
jgi:uncharacterized membrane protein YgcG